MSEKLPVVLIGGVVLMTFWFSTPAPSLPDGSKAVPASTEFHAARTGQQADAEVVAKDHGSGAVLGRWWLRDGELYEPAAPESGDQPIRSVDLSIVRHRYLGLAVFDLGTFASFTNADLDPDDPDHFQIGIRASPYRVLYGTTALDGVLTRDGIGAGISFYPPASRVGQWWAHWGVGTWYVLPTDSRGESGWCFGLAFSTRD